MMVCRHTRGYERSEAEPEQGNVAEDQDLWDAVLARRAGEKPVIMGLTI
jgi:hypothetical protein